MSYKQTYDWDHVKDADVDKFYREVVMLAKKRFGIDCDGDCPIDVTIINRARQQSNHFGTLEHLHKIENQAEKIKAVRRNLRTANANASMASEQLRSVMFDVEDLFKLLPEEVK